MKNFNPEEPSKGLGDSIAKITHALGLDKLADDIAHAVGDEDCGCERRKEYLNELFPYKQTSTEPAYYEALRKFDLTAGDEKVEYEKGEVIQIGPQHIAYRELDHLLNSNTLKKL